MIFFLVFFFFKVVNGTLHSKGVLRVFRSFFITNDFYVFRVSLAMRCVQAYMYYIKVFKLFTASCCCSEMLHRFGLLPSPNQQHKEYHMPTFLKLFIEKKHLNSKRYSLESMMVGNSRNFPEWCMIG